MYEVEVKVQAAREAVRPRLLDAGGDPRGTVTQVDTYFDAPDRDFAATDEALRIREQSGDASTTYLTYKGPRLDDRSKSRREVETTVGDAEAAAALLEHLGFEPAATVRKERERFELAGYTVVLDRVRDVGEFVEVETETTDVEAARDGAVAVLERLDLDPDDGIRTSYLELLLEAT